MIAVWILGPLLAWLTGAYLDTWLQIKFVLVIVMSGVHGFMCVAGGLSRDDRNTHPRAVLSNHQRSADAADGADRDLGQGSAIWRLKPLDEPPETLIAPGPERAIFASAANHAISRSFSMTRAATDGSAALRAGKPVAGQTNLSDDACGADRLACIGTTSPLSQVPSP